MSEWTVATLKEHLEAVVNEHDHRYEQRWAAGEKALTQAKAEAERRLDALNEIRQAYGDTMPRTEVEFRLQGMQDKIDGLRLSVRGEEVSTSRARDLRLTLPAGVAAMSSLVSVIFAMVTVIH